MKYVYMLLVVTNYPVICSDEGELAEVIKVMSSPEMVEVPPPLPEVVEVPPPHKKCELGWQHPA